ELGEKRDSGIEGFHHDADVVHPLKRHAATLVPSSLRHAHRTSAPADGCAVGTMASLFVPLRLTWARGRECHLRPWRRLEAGLLLVQHKSQLSRSKRARSAKSLIESGVVAYSAEVVVSARVVAEPR